MATLDNAVWLTGAGSTAADGTTVITEGGNTTTVTGTFTANTWDASQGGNNVSEFGAVFITAPIFANYDFSNPVENLSFDINHLNDDGASRFDDSWTIYAYDENGALIPATTVIAGLSGLVDEAVITNPDGSVTIQSADTVANDVTIDLAGPIGALNRVRMAHKPAARASVISPSISLRPLLIVTEMALTTMLIWTTITMVFSIPTKPPR